MLHREGKSVVLLIIWVFRNNALSLTSFSSFYCIEFFSFFDFFSYLLRIYERCSLRFGTAFMGQIFSCISLQCQSIISITFFRRCCWISSILFYYVFLSSFLNLFWLHVLSLVVYQDSFSLHTIVVISSLFL